MCCDFSLEMYKSRAAEDNEDIVLRRFQSGSKGFVSAADHAAPPANSMEMCAVCVKDGVEMDLTLTGVFSTQDLVTLKCENEAFADEVVPVKFHSKDSHGKFIGYRDGVILPSGRFLILQSLMEGTKATVTKALPAEIAAAAKGETAFDPDASREFTHVEAYDLIG